MRHAWGMLASQWGLMLPQADVQKLCREILGFFSDELPVMP